MRAYVFVEHASVVADGNRLSARLDLKNAGQTPAYDLTVISQIDTDGAEKRFTLKPFQTFELPHGILGPGMTMNPVIDLVIPPENTIAIPTLKEGRGIIYVYGQAEYRDAFQQTWVLDFRFRSYSFDGTRWVMAPTPEGNQEAEKK